MNDIISIYSAKDKVIIMAFFKKAVPVWLKEKENEPNCQAVFTVNTDGLNKAVLYISGFTAYRVFINGKFAHFGPARTAKGYARVDILPLPDCETGVSKSIMIEAVGYRCFALCTANQPSFICAEIRNGDGSVVAATGYNFTAYEPKTHLQKVMRYSRQRHYSEVYDYRALYRDFSILEPAETAPIPEPPVFIERHAPIAEYNTTNISECRYISKYSYDENTEIKKSPYGLEDVMPVLGEFPYNEMEYIPYQYIQKCRIPMGNKTAGLPAVLCAGQFALIDLKKVCAGFITADIDALSESDIVVGFSEYCEGEFYVNQPNSSINVLEYLLGAKKHYELSSLEPYSFRYIVILVKSGEIRLNGSGYISFNHPSSRLRSENFDDSELNAIWNASKRSFAHNSIDIYTDCPSRERGGWLCDSYFSGKVEYYMTGSSVVERDFLENFVLRPADDPKETSHGNVLPDGMLPMCYPSDHYVNYIPQWAMWYVLELYEYLTARNPGADRGFFLPVIEKLVSFFEKFENSDGLLEKLGGWNFVEWSKANSWVQDVNYPTNFLYSEMLRLAAKLLNREDLRIKAEKVKKTALEKSFNGEFFTDNAVYKDGVLVNTGNISETCQYYALRFCSVNINDPKYSVLKNAVLNVFGPKRTTEYPEIEKSNAFIGMYVRTEVLLKLKLYDKMLSDIKGYFGYMASSTQTLWEYSEPKGSLNHGFASYAAYAIAVAYGKDSRQTPTSLRIS